MGDQYKDYDNPRHQEALQQIRHRHRLQEKLDILRDSNPKTDQEKIERLEEMVELMLRLGTF